MKSSKRLAPVFATALLLASACDQKRDRAVTGDPSTASSSSAKSIASAPFVITALSPTDGELAPLLKAEVAKAKKSNLKPFVEFHAAWCGPCVALEKSMSDQRMIDAFDGTYVIRLDLDDWSSKLEGTGFRANAIPVFYRLDDDGKPTGKTIDGGAWEDNIPENMAPPLKAFFRS